MWDNSDVLLYELTNFGGFENTKWLIFNALLNMNNEKNQQGQYLFWILNLNKGT